MSIAKPLVHAGLLVGALVVVARADGDANKALAAVKLADQVTYRGLEFPDAACQQAFGRAGKVSRKDAPRFRACLAKLILRADDAFAAQGGGQGPTSSFYELASTHTNLRLSLVHDEQAHGVVPLTRERLIAVAAYDRDAARAHLLQRLPAGSEHVPPGEATRKAMKAAKVDHVSTRIRVCDDEAGEMSMCGVEGNSAIPEYDHDVSEHICTMGKLGAFRPDDTPIRICAVIDVVSP